MADHQPPDIVALSTKRHPHPDFVCSLTHAKCQHAVQSDGAEKERDRAEDAEHGCAESPRAELTSEHGAEGNWVRRRKLGKARSHRAPDRGAEGRGAPRGADVEN